MLHHRHRDLRRILFGVVDGVVRHDGFVFVVVVAAGVEVAIKAREVAAGDGQAEPVPGGKSPGRGP